jgi:AcrR family transcriptional regulator
VGRPREHDDATREALRAAAEQLFAASGPGAVSVRSVANAVGTGSRVAYAVALDRIAPAVATAA